MQHTHKAMLKTLQGEVLPRPPFWLMRQAGRYLPEYRELRKKAGSFLDLCYTPDFAVEVTLQPLRRFDMDAAILFSDILVVPHALGMKLTFAEGEGPRLPSLKTRRDIEALSFDHFDDMLKPVYQTLKTLRQKLAPEKTLIGFAGAPWTIACYMIQGFGDGEFASVKEYAYKNPDDFSLLISRITEATTRYLKEQIRSGADTVQLFDSWAGVLPEPFFRQYVIEPAKQIVADIRAEFPHFPIIGFPREAGTLYTDYAIETRVNAVSVDTRAELGFFAKALRGKTALQGNLDPVALLAGGQTLENEIRRILAATEGVPFIFNLGHGIIKETPIEHVELMARMIKAHAA